MYKATVNQRVETFKLFKNISSKTSRDLLTRLYAEEIAKESRKYITQGKVKPSLKDTTIIHRRKRGVVNQKPLLFKKGLRDSIKATDKGISFAAYGQYHREGYDVPDSAYARANGFVNQKVRPREFITYGDDFTDVSIKKRIDKRVRKRFLEIITRR